MTVVSAEVWRARYEARWIVRSGLLPLLSTGTVDVQPWGEDSEWLLTEGHVDLDAFAVAAIPHLAELGADSFDIDAKHRWARPITRADCDSDEQYQARADDGWVRFTNDPLEPDSEPITVMDVSW